MNDVPDTGSMPVSPITRTAMAPSMKVVAMSTVANKAEATTGKPPRVKMAIIEKKVTAMKMGMCLSGHSYQPLPSMYSALPSPRKAEPMSLKMARKVLYIFASPNSPPPTMQPMATVRMVLANAIICRVAAPPAAKSCSGMSACAFAS